jgi:hypothetical protein
MQRPLHAGRIAVEPPLEVVEDGLHYGRFVGRLRRLLNSHHCLLSFRRR